MRILRLAFVVLALVGATACGAGRPKPSETAETVAALLRSTWGSTMGSPSFDYRCTKLDARGQLFTCLAKDRTDTVKIASFDVICDEARCSWRAYPAYAG